MLARLLMPVCQRLEAHSTPCRHAEVEVKTLLAWMYVVEVLCGPMWMTALGTVVAPEVSQEALDCSSNSSSNSGARMAAAP